MKLLFAAIVFSFFQSTVLASTWTASISCNGILNPQLIVPDLMAQIKTEARRQFHATTNVANIYERYLQPTDSNAQVLQMRAMVDSKWTFHMPNEKQNIWNQLTSSQKLDLLESIEEAFSHGRYDERLIPESKVSYSSIGAFAKLLTTQAINKEANFAFSPLHFLGGALSGQPIGICRHYNLATATLLFELGVSPQDLQVVVGTAPTTQTSHVYIEVQVDGRWLMVDPIVEDAIPTASEVLNFDDKLFKRATLTKMRRAHFHANMMSYSFGDNQRTEEDQIADDLFDDILKAIAPKR